MTSSVQLAPCLTDERSSATVAFLPIYYTSESFVEPLREDVSALLDAFATQLSDAETSLAPFTLFKTIWKEQGWNYIHLKCLESRSRVTFLKTVFRVFIENISASNSGLVQAASLFSLYIFYRTQPPLETTGVYALNKMPVAIDTYNYIIKELADAVPAILQPHVLYVLHQLTSSSSFSVLPESSLFPYNTRNLPNATAVPYQYASTKGGRPSKSQQIVRTRAALNSLDQWLNRIDNPRQNEMDVDSDNAAAAAVASSSAAAPARTNQPPTSKYLWQKAQKAAAQAALPVDLTSPEPAEYIALKAKLKDVIPPDVLRKAENDTRETMAGVAEYATKMGIVPNNGWGGLKRMQEQKGILDFIKGVTAVPVEGERERDAGPSGEA